MVDVKISGLQAAAALTGNEAIPAVQGGGNVKILVSAIRAGLASDGSVVHTTGAESIGGAKTFSAKSTHSLGARMGVDQLLEMGGAGATLRGNGTGSLVIGSAGPSTGGLILLRPQGDQVATNQVTIYTNGAMDFSGDAASKAQTRTSLGSVGLSGAETIAGLKTFSDLTQWKFAGAGTIEYGLPAGVPGIVGRAGDPAGGVDAQYRTDLRFAAGFCQLITRTAMGSGAGAKGFQIDNNMFPVENNTMSFGKASNLWTQLWANNATIGTSDARLKTPLETMTDAEEAAFLEINELPMKWKWLERVAEEGDAARWHAGPSVQAAIAVMEKHGLSAFAYSAFCYDSWPAEDEVWREWPAQEAEVVEWPAVPETWVDIPAEVDEAGETVVPARRELVHEAMPAGRVVLKEAVEAGRELIQSAVEAGDRYSFRVSELQAWILAATARRDRREREAAELRLASVEQRLAVLESGK